MNRSTANGLACILVLSILLFLGCSKPIVREVSLDSRPQGAEVKATADQEGPEDFLLGDTPVTHKFTFAKEGKSGATMYNLEFSLEGYETATETLRRDDDKNSIEVSLRKEQVREITRFEAVVSDEGYIIKPKLVRSWVEDIERDVRAASSIVRLGGHQSVLGMTLTDDGKTLVFSLAEEYEDQTRKEKTMATLRSVHSRGGGITQVTSGKWLDANPACTYGGKYLLYNSNRLRKNGSDLFRISSERVGGIAVVRQTSDGYNYEPCVSRNGVIAFTYKPIYKGKIVGTEQIWTLGGKNEYPTQLREGTMPAISPDGNQIAYVGPDKQLWKVPVTGQNPVQLTASSINIEGKKHPAWSPDGKYIIFASDEGKDGRDVPNYDIWIIKQDGTNLRQLTTNGSLDDFPVISKEQDYIYFVSNRGFKEGIWRIPFPPSL